MNPQSDDNGFSTRDVLPDLRPGEVNETEPIKFTPGKQLILDRGSLMQDSIAECVDPFEERIQKMNDTFKLPSNDTPADQGNDRLLQIEEVLHDEVTELLDVPSIEDPIERFVAVADCLGDVVVYCFSEARRWGIPLLDVLHIIMDSQDSKLVDGQPVMAPDGSKFIKGPNYVPPEPELRKLFKRLTVPKP